jgi:hypothetical protein
MAQIDIQEKKGQPAWVWIALVVGLLVLGGVIWALTRNGDDRDDVRMEHDTVPAAPRAPTGGIDRPDEAVLALVVFSQEPAQAAPAR